MSKRSDRDAALIAADELAEAELAFEKAKKDNPRCETCGRTIPGAKRSKAEQTARDNLDTARTDWRENHQPILDSLGISPSIVATIKAEANGG